MEGVEFQLRNPHHDEHGDALGALPKFPLTLDERLAQGDAYRIAGERLRHQLKEIEKYDSSLESGTHTGPPCSKCHEKKSRTHQAYHDYYLSCEPGTWTLFYPQLRQHLTSMLSNPNVIISEVHKLYIQNLRDHLQNDLCHFDRTDSPALATFKSLVRSKFREGEPEGDIINYYLENINCLSESPKELKLIRDLQETQTPEERAALYAEYYCSTSSNEPDSASVRFKRKYEKIFLSPTPHDEVIAMMRKEVNETRDRKLKDLNAKLRELEMGQKAHLKQQQKKRDREVSEQIVDCSLEDCPIEINLNTDEVIECAVCEWLSEMSKEARVGQRERRQRTIYCSAEHADDDFNTHDSEFHACAMGSRCFYYPSKCPKIRACGLCNNCLSHGYISFFCSARCYESNLDLHREDFMNKDIGIHNDDDALETYIPAKDMEFFDLTRYGESGGQAEVAGSGQVERGNLSGDHGGEGGTAGNERPRDARMEGFDNGDENGDGRTWEEGELEEAGSYSDR